MLKCLLRPIKVRQLLRTFSTSSRFQDEDNLQEILDSDSEYLKYAESHLKVQESVNCYIIQPYIKWGPQKRQNITPTEQLQEAKALITTLPSWTAEDTIAIPLESIDKKTIFRSGSLAKLKQIIRQNANINAVFINESSLKRVQNVNLEKEFGVPILDRYKIVMQILKIHATSKHAKLQVALAELYYLQRRTLGAEFDVLAKGDKEKMKLMFQSREQKLKTAINELRNQRSLLRNKRSKNDYPIIAVVGYTNSGKTSLIKALTGDQLLKPRNQLFATLDVTMHAGLLPSGLQVLYVDTVGFISDIPTKLIECFVATLEDAVLADVILHVEDLSSSCFDFKRQHVNNTLKELSDQSGTVNVLDKIITVGNKCDLENSIIEDSQLLKVSAKTDVGLDVLRFTLERSLLQLTDRRNIKIKVPNGGEEVRWLYKNSTVVSESVDPKSSEFIIADVIIKNGKLEQFKHNFAK